MRSDPFALMAAGTHAPSPRRVARVLDAVQSRARRRCPAGIVRPYDCAGWRDTLLEAVRLAPEIPVKSWAMVVLHGWPRGDESLAPMAGVFAAQPAALAHLAAVVTVHSDAAHRLAPSARRRALAILTAIGPVPPEFTPKRLRGRVERWQHARREAAPAEEQTAA